MILDLHVHVSAFTPAHGGMSRRILDSVPFRVMRWRLGIRGEDEVAERAIEAKLVATIAGAEKLDAAVVLAFDAVHRREDGALDPGRTHLHVTNDYVIELARRHRQILFGASVHPYRRDAVAEVERCVRAGAALMKCLPIVQDIDPADDRCLPFYEALAHFKLPLLSHTGGEKTLPNINPHVADPALLKPALDRGVTVIMAHCGTRSAPGERDYCDTFMRMAKEHERCFGDTAALSLPTRSHAYPLVLADPAVRRKLVHGSDWAVPTIPPATQLPIRQTLATWREPNWMRRDVMIKEALGFDADYWRRGAEVLGVGGGRKGDA